MYDFADSIQQRVLKNVAIQFQMFPALVGVAVSTA
jgi:hypothetical protein